jgi:hypothetical protein
MLLIGLLIFSKIVYIFMVLKFESILLNIESLQLEVHSIYPIQKRFKKLILFNNFIPLHF